VLCEGDPEPHARAGKVLQLTAVQTGQARLAPFVIAVPIQKRSPPTNASPPRLRGYTLR
jgi:hypothetical protein